MTATDHLNAVLNKTQFRYFHGSPGGIEGGVVLPPRQGTGRSMSELAFATSRVRDAMNHGAIKARDEGRLFGSVYEVDPRNPVPSPMGDPKHIASAEGLDVVKHTGFVHWNEEGAEDKAKWL